MQDVRHHPIRLTGMGTAAVSAIFDPTRWREVEGFDFTDITYHRHVGPRPGAPDGPDGDLPTVRIAFHRPEVRNAFHRLVEVGWVDAVRALHPEQRVYTFWKYLRNAFERDAGLRIDETTTT